MEALRTVSGPAVCVRTPDQRPRRAETARGSHHLAVLTDAGLLSREKRGKWAYYRVVAKRLAVLRDVLGASVPAS